jgi:hypothetical protein
VLEDSRRALKIFLYRLLFIFRASFDLWANFKDAVINHSWIFEGATARLLTEIHKRWNFGKKEKKSKKKNMRKYEKKQGQLSKKINVRIEL